MSDHADKGGTPQREKRRAPPIDSASTEAEQCIECGRAINTTTPHKVCADCSLRNLLNNSFQQTIDFGSQPLVEHPEQDLTLDHHGRIAFLEPLPVGKRIGQFEIVRRLGRGGMGTVYEAHDLENQRRVALKVLNRPVESDAARAQFLREGRLAASINHPNSVFVYGTHQHDQYSLISMELVDGGTLEQRVRKQGPLRHRAAVDVGLQIMDGLDAAYKRGILHRDIKPANCFEATDGTVKIGDYGLSISTAPGDEPQPGMKGLLLGTPAFSSPEQLRGDALDVRSDIYALGVTLYFLLTGRTPYQADSLAKLLAQVFEDAPQSPRILQPHIPPQLAHLVMRCLAKEPGDRFRNYDELRSALLPFSSQVPEPASLGWRAIAGLMDWGVLGGVSFLYSLVVALSFPSIATAVQVSSVWGAMLFLVVHWLYYAICETAFGQTLGKWLVGLQTIGVPGGRPSIGQSSLRAAVFVLLPCLITLPYSLAMGGEVRPPTAEFGWELWLGLLVTWSHWGLLAAMFSSARRGNGMAGWHELASGTRVVSSRTQTTFPKLEGFVQSSSVQRTGSVVGPYQLLSGLVTSDGSEMLLAYEPILMRKVWLRCGQPSLDTQVTPRVSIANSARHTRTTRLRWLNRFHEHEKVWDVYEAPTGGGLLNCLQPELLSPCMLHRWLADLVKELDAVSAGEAVPEALAADRLWLTEEGRLKVLDFPAPGVAASSSPCALRRDLGAEQCQVMLHELAPHLRVAGMTTDSSVLPPPLYVTRMLTAWESDDDYGTVLEATRKASLRSPISARRRRRWMSIACYFAPIAMVVSLLASQLLSAAFFSQEKDLQRLRALMQIVHDHTPAQSGEPFSDAPIETLPMQSSSETDLRSREQYLAAKTLVAGEFADLHSDPRLQTLTAVAYMPPAMRGEISAIQAAAEPTVEEIAAAADLLEEPIRERTLAMMSSLVFGYQSAILFAFSVWAFYVALPAIMAGLLFRGGLVVHGFQAVIVGKHGKAVGRLRIGFRALLCALPGLVALFLMLSSQVALLPPMPVATLVSVVLSVLCAIVSNCWGARSLADRLLGTAVVAR